MHTERSKTKLKEIQNEAAGASKLVSVDGLLRVVGWDQFSPREKKYKVASH